MAESIYPNGIDGYAQLPLAIDGVTKIDASTVNRLRNSIVKVETELGIKPSGTYPNVRARLDALENSVPTDLESRVQSLEDRADIIENDISDIENNLQSNLVYQRINQLYAISVITTNTTLDETYGTVLVDSTSGNIIITLPPASNGTMFYRIKKIDSTSNLVIISPQSGENIDGETSFEINFQYDSYSIINSSTNWFNV